MIDGRRPSRLSGEQLKWLAGVSPAQFAGLVEELGPVWEQARFEKLTAPERFSGLAGSGRAGPSRCRSRRACS
jgi:hypothetical protein